jgi:hypothetical protein
MTANEMANLLDEKLDRVSSFGSPGYEDFDMSSVLTEAYHFYVKKFIDELNNRKGKGFQENEIRNQGLGGLISTALSLTQSASQAGVLQNGKFYDLPMDHMYTVFEECTINKTDCKTNLPIRAYIKEMGYNEIQTFDKSKYKKPFYKVWGDARVWRFSYSRFESGYIPASSRTAKRHEIVTDGTFNVTTYFMRYLKNPLPIVVDRTTPNNQRNCELDDSTHMVIVDTAMDLMLERVKEQKMQIRESFRDLE